LPGFEFVIFAADFLEKPFFRSLWYFRQFLIDLPGIYLPETEKWTGSAAPSEFLRGEPIAH
jgi:hypothetical protein